MTTRPAHSMLDELKWVHDMIRRDLAAVRALAASVDRGAPADAVRSTLGELQTRGPLWQLRVNCLRYCQHVHLHHGLEDAMVFPAVRAADRSLTPVVDRLEADHRKVSDVLDRTEAAATALDSASDPRQRVAAALTELSDLLLEHLAYEEESLGPLLSTWRS